MHDERDDAEKQVFDQTLPIPKDWFVRRRLLALGVPATMVAMSFALGGQIIPNPFVNGV